MVRAGRSTMRETTAERAGRPRTAGNRASHRARGSGGEAGWNRETTSRPSDHITREDEMAAKTDLKTARKPDHGDDPLYALRHSTAHVMAGAVLELFPDAKFGFGPPVADGFYYDFDLPRPLQPDDLARIEERMRAMVRKDLPFERDELDIPDALRLFGERHQDYKVDQIEKLDETVQDGRVSTYRHDDFVDLCRGPHVGRTGEIGRFKLMSIAGAYWRGDEHNPQLQRVYGTVWPTQAELDAYLERLKEIERRDHRTLGRDLELFRIDEELGSGLVLWLPNLSVVRGRSPPVVVLGGRSPPAVVLDQADELPGPHQGLSVAGPLVPGATAAHRRARHGVPVRTRWHAPWDAPRARLHAGRLAHLLHLGAGAGGDRQGLRPGDGVPARLWLHGPAHLPRDTPGAPARHRRDVGQGGGRAPRGARRARSAVRDRRGRRRLLRAEDRHQDAGRDRPRVAGSDGPDRPQPARALRRDVRRRARPARAGGDDPPGAVRQPGAVRRRAHRALRRQFPALAVLGAGRGHPGARERASVRRRGRVRAPRARPSPAPRPPARRYARADQGSPGTEGELHARRRRSRSGGPNG